MDHTFHTPSFGDEEFSIPQYNHHLGSTNEVVTSDYNPLAKAMSPSQYQHHWNNDGSMNTYGGYNHMNHHQQQQQQQQPVAVQHMHNVVKQEPPSMVTNNKIYGQSPTYDNEEKVFINNNKNNIKRSSPSYAQNDIEDEVKANPVKKAKVVKKKAKKDPNEPQK